jgi:AMMECR1 domain-containing protein
MSRLRDRVSRSVALTRARDLWGWNDDLERVLSFLRTIALEEDFFFLDTPTRKGVHHFPFPSLPSARPVRVACATDDARVRFVVRAFPPREKLRRRDLARGIDGPNVDAPPWRAIVRLRGLLVSERDAPHGRGRPLRLGLDAEEGWVLLCAARGAAESFLEGQGEATAIAWRPEDPPRLSQRSAVAVAIWTRGRLRGSVVSPPGPALRTVRQAAAWACQDARFERLTFAELTDTVFQVGLVHAPSVPLSHREIAAGDAYPDKALFLSEGTRSGVYMPEIHNLEPHRKLLTLVASLAREKAGLEGFGAATSVEVNAVTDFVESADRSSAVRLDGPVACLAPEPATLWREGAREAGVAAARWLETIQREDGSLPLRVKPAAGDREATDPVRIALTAWGLVAFGNAIGLDAAARTAARASAWLDRARATWKNGPHALLTTCYRGQAAWAVGDEPTFERAVVEVLDGLDSGPRGSLDLANAASFLRLASARDARAKGSWERLRVELEERFRSAIDGNGPVSLAEWAEIGVWSPEVATWARAQQLPSGAFPDSTRSDFAYTRGTGKIFEVLAVRPAESTRAIERSVAWLRAMQYRADSVFFVPEEHRARTLGGFRHDAYDTRAWIDAAGHFLIGLARLEAGQERA